MEMLCIWIKLAALLLIGTTLTNAEERCLSTDRRNTRFKLASAYGEKIFIQVSNNVLHQISSRIFGTIAREMLDQKVEYEEIDLKDAESETHKLYETLEQIVKYKEKSVLNMGVWMPADYHMPPPGLEMVGRFSTGRFGWFFPKKLVENIGFPNIIPFSIFKDNESVHFQRFLFDESILKSLTFHQLPESSHKYFIFFSGRETSDYIPDHCKYQKCITLLSGHREDTSFVTNHIEDLKLYAKIAWFGDNLRYVTQALHKKYSDENKKLQKAFIVVHWTPSEIIDADIEYDTIIMPKCEQFAKEESISTLCKYELTPILKYCSEILRNAKTVLSVLNELILERNDENYLLQMYNNMTDLQITQYSEVDAVMTSDDTVRSQLLTRRNFITKKDKEDAYDKIACQYIRKYEETINENINAIVSKRKVYIGGLYPKREEEENEYLGIYGAVKMAQKDINNSPILPDVELIVIDSNEGCRLDSVMRKFINYYVRPDGVLGVLGPSCSETVEPVASLSKHIHMAIISYAAEGVSFKNGEYPYFFRTIGENRQYEHVYVRLFKELDWRRVVAFTEEGQKYTEYILQLKSALKENGIDLTNEKFSKYFSPEKIRSMSARNGYVWFLPIWLDKNSKELYESPKVNCTREEMNEILDGHISLANQPYASEQLIMQTNKTVGQWKKGYKRSNTSHYGGYAYDAVWVFAYALNKLIGESPEYLATIHSENTTARFIQIISETDFNGVSGRIQFGKTGSRFSNINVLQWIDNENHVVGTFEPNVTEVNGNRIIQGGNFNFSASNIKWLTPTNEIPHDGTNVCSVGGLAHLLGIDCSQTLLIITAILCSLLVILLSATSFVFLKRRYDQKLKASTKLMRNFGIDLLSMSPVCNTPDKWEIPKDRVVINRRLGEGAFGTVYGGEAQIGDQGWTAVAVKTLKKGSNTEDRIDFLSEAEAMKRFDHANVVSLLGVCLQTEPIYAVMEFMLYGDLKTYLLARRHLVNEKICDDSDISPKRLTMMALDVARALSYLSEMKYVHRDVACRNCLVNAQRVVKLGDFGMARSTSENDYYRFSRKGMLPVRWMAPESLSFGKFTPASDIWSFEVLLYEIITFGSFPFQGMTNNQVLEHVKDGNILTIPNGIKPQLEGLMKACWNISHVKRPTASEVAEFISSYPKLVTASLDVPLASVQIPETESDQLELLPGLRQTHDDDNEQTEPTYSNHVRIPNGIMLSEFNAANDDYTMSNPATPSITYNPIEPLLAMYQDGSNNGSLRRYVPMCGIKKGNHTLEMNEHVI